MLPKHSRPTLFKFNDQDIRVVTLDGAPWFAAKDVCSYLGYIPDAGGSFSKTLTRHVDDDDRRVAFRERHHDTSGLFGSRSARVAVISEAGLYALVTASKKPEAQEFKRWVTREVLPSIRKTGAYVTGQPSLQENPQMDPLDLMLAQAAKLEARALETSKSVS